MTMWAYIYNGQKVIKKRVPIPKLRPNDVLVKIDKVSICGSDFHIFSNDDWAKESVTPGIIIGHEGCGEIVQLGNDVKNFSIGDFVALESHYSSKICEIQNKTADQCDDYGIIGIHGVKNNGSYHQIGGTFAEYIAIPYYCCYKINKQIKDKIPASLLEPAGNSWEIIRYLKTNKLPDHLAIYGCGPHGLNLQLFARYIGIKNIIAFEVDPWRLNFAKQFNMAHHILNPTETTNQDILNLTNRQGFDIAIDMVGSIKVIEMCKVNVRDGGVILLFGLPKQEILLDHGHNFSQVIFNQEEFCINYNNKQLTIKGLTGRSHQTWIELLEALKNSQMLREKISQPIQYIGSLHELEKFINNPPEHFLKIGMTAFK